MRWIYIILFGLVFTGVIFVLMFVNAVIGLAGGIDSIDPVVEVVYLNVARIIFSPLYVIDFVLPSKYLGMTPTHPAPDGLHLVYGSNDRTWWFKNYDLVVHSLYGVFVFIVGGIVGNYFWKRKTSRALSNGIKIK